MLKKNVNINPPLALAEPTKKSLMALSEHPVAKIVKCMKKTLTASEHVKGVHVQPTASEGHEVLRINPKGVSPAGAAARAAQVPQLKDKYNSKAKAEHHKVIGEMKNMANPKLTRSELEKFDALVKKHKENPDAAADAKLGENVEHLVEDHMIENSSAEKKEGHKVKFTKSDVEEFDKKLAKHWAEISETKKAEMDKSEKKKTDTERRNSEIKNAPVSNYDPKGFEGKKKTVKDLIAEKETKKAEGAPAPAAMPKPAMPKMQAPKMKQPAMPKMKMPGMPKMGAPAPMKMNMQKNTEHPVAKIIKCIKMAKALGGVGSPGTPTPSPDGGWGATIVKSKK